MYEKSVNIYENLHGENHPDTSKLYNNIGIIYRN